MAQENEKIYSAALIIIGDEVLSGRTKDANTPYIAEKLNDAGVRLKEVRIIPDHAQTIIDTVNEMRNAHDYVFTTGGIGPKNLLEYLKLPNVQAAGGSWMLPKSKVQAGDWQAVTQLCREASELSNMKELTQ